MPIRPRPSRTRRLGLVLSLQRAHRALPRPPHPPRLRPGPHPALLASARSLALPLGSLPALRRTRSHPAAPLAPHPALPHPRGLARSPPLGRHHSRLLHPLLAAGVLPPPRAPRARAPRRGPARRSGFSCPHPHHAHPLHRRRPPQHPPQLPLRPRPHRHTALPRLRILRPDRARTAPRRHAQRPPQLQPSVLQPLARPHLRPHRLRDGLLPLAAHRRRHLHAPPRPRTASSSAAASSPALSPRTSSSPPR